MLSKKPLIKAQKPPFIVGRFVPVPSFILQNLIFCRIPLILQEKGNDISLAFQFELNCNRFGINLDSKNKRKSYDFLERTKKKKKENS